MPKKKSDDAAGQRPRVEIVKTSEGPQLVVDGLRRPYGVLPDGRYYLRDYAYDRTDDLEELGRRYADHLDRATALRAERGEA